MRNKLLLIIILGLVSITAFSQKKDKLVLITTEYGDIKIKLYNDTPKHRDNFLKLVKEGFYEDLLFHRVIKEFMIQGGDPESKGAGSNQQLGNGGPGYTIPAEFVSKYYHKKGALAAARLGDNVNPAKESSGSQFYIVHGKPFTNDQMDQMENRMNESRKGTFLLNWLNDPANVEYKNRIDSLKAARDFPTLKNILNELEEKTAEDFDKTDKFKYTEEQRKAYTTIGGAPHLDGAYTVFGEVVEGLDVIDKIAQVKTASADRPVQDVKMNMKIVKK